MFIEWKYMWGNWTIFKILPKYWKKILKMNNAIWGKSDKDS